MCSTRSRPQIDAPRPTRAAALLVAALAALLALPALLMAGAF